jgi:hypothetical protein
MRLDFNVLWVDDQPDRVAAQIAAITTQMAEHGFQFNATPCKFVDEVRERIADNVFTDEVDLVLVDWDLGAGSHGEDAIAAIREDIRYKDVVFYSAMKPAEDLRQLAYDSGLEGIYCASREELVDEVMGVFESLVRKVLDLDHSRGIVMGATSDIDHIVNECLALMHEKLDGSGKDAMVGEMVKRIQDRIDNLVARAAKLAASKDLPEIFKSYEIFSSSDRLRILGRMLKVEKFKAHGDTRAKVVAYLQDVVPERTGLAHLVLVPEGKPQTVVTNEGLVVTLDEARDLRRQILELRGDFRGLLLALKAMT